ncbi:MAG: HD domain-containing protein [Bacilli bacterium]
MNINQKLVSYLDQHIIPLYTQLDKAHGRDHVQAVIKKSFIIGEPYHLNPDMLYTIAVFHDLGLLKDRNTHHLIGGEMLFKDPILESFFSKEELTTMKEAVEDHRASAKSAPRSIYGMVIAEADRESDAKTVIKRALLYRKETGLSFDDIFPDVHAHLIEKYGRQGYLKVWLKTPYTTKMLEDIWSLLDEPRKLKNLAYQIYQSLEANQTDIFD